MKKLLLLLVIISFNTSFSQEENTNETSESLKKTKKFQQENSYFVFGASQMDFSELSTYLNVADFNTNLYYLGFGSLDRYNRVYVESQFSFYLNQTREISDSSRTKLAGVSYFLSFGYDLLNNKKLSVIPMLGIGYQHMTLQVEEDKFTSPFAGIERVKYHLYNPALMFDLGLAIKVPIYRKVSFSLKGGYKLDTSNPAWKYDGDKLNVNSNLNGAYAQFSLIFDEIN